MVCDPFKVLREGFFQSLVQRAVALSQTASQALICIQHAWRPRGIKFLLEDYFKKLAVAITIDCWSFSVSTVKSTVAISRYRRISYLQRDHFGTESQLQQISQGLALGICLDMLIVSRTAVLSENKANNVKRKTFSSNLFPGLCTFWKSLSKPSFQIYRPNELLKITAWECGVLFG